MSLEDFLKFVDKTIGELILYAELHAGQDFSDYSLEFQWISYEKTLTRGWENIVYEVADKVYVSEDKIYPCVDLIVERPEGIASTLRITGRRAGYEPRPFGRGWSNRPGPFIYGIGSGIKSTAVNTDSLEFQRKLKELGLIHYQMK
jgi:hypothetical protein